MTTQTPRIPPPQEPRDSVNWYKYLQDIQARSPIAGTVTMSGTSATVTLPQALPDTDYVAALEAPENKKFWVTSKTTTGFTVNADASSTATVGYIVVRQ